MAYHEMEMFLRYVVYFFILFLMLFVFLPSVVAQLMPLPLTVSCFSKIQIGFAFLVLAHPGSPGQRAIKRMCVCVCFDAVDWVAGRASCL